MSIIQAIITSIVAFFLAIFPVSTYTEGVTGQPSSFFPSQTYQQIDKTISKLIYRGLFKYDIYGALVPDLADTWTLSDDGIVYTIKIKDNQYWSNGRPITSDDLIYTSFKVPDLAGVATDRVDDLTVRYTLPNKYSPFLSLLTEGVMPSNAEENQSPLKPVSSGDFRIGRVEKNGDLVRQITLVNNHGAQSIKKLAFRFYANEEELLTAAKLGEVDGFMSRKDHGLKSFENYKFPLQGIYYAIYFNLEEEALQDVSLRSNLERVLPLEDLIVNEGISVQGAISRSLFTDTSLNYDKHVEGLKLDLGDIKITLSIPDDDDHYDFAKKLQAYWREELGVEIVIRRIASEEMMEKVIIPRNYEMLLFGQEVGRDPDRYVNWHSTQASWPGLNLSNFSHVRADRALEEGRNENTNERRVIHYNEFQKVIGEQVPAIFLYHPYMNYYIKHYIDGVGEKYTFSNYDRFLDFSNWSRVKIN